VKDGIISDIYFFGGFGFLIGRTVIVTLLAARIPEQSKVILPLLYTCSTSTYNVEVNRSIFIDVRKIIKINSKCHDPLKLSTCCVNYLICLIL